MYFSISANNETLGVEGYELEIKEDQITLEANQPAGIFRGIQTLKQLFESEVEKKTDQNLKWELATGKITDYPKYEYRGAMLDVSRHFFSVSEVN